MKRHKKRIQLVTSGLLVVVILAAAAPYSYLPVTAVQETDARAETSTTLYFPIVYQNLASPGIPIFGVQMYGNTGSSSVYHPYLLESGSSWLRVPVAWRTIEPNNVTPAAYAWNSTDSILAAAREDMGGLNVIATIESAPVWAAVHDNGPINGGNLADLAEFVGALVERYDGDGFNDAPGSPRVRHWEFYNEPDGGHSSGTYARWGHDGDKYAQMLATVYPAVKAADPGAKVVMGGIAYDWFEEDGGPFVRTFINDVLASGGGQYFDIMNFHYYPAFSPNWTSSSGPGLTDKTVYLRNLLNSYGVNKPIIITESGWHDNNAPSSPSTPEKQSRYVVELFTQSMAADVDVMIWWMLYDAGGFYPYNTGLVTNGTTPLKKIAFHTFRLIVSELRTARFARTLTAAETGAAEMEVYQFQDNVNSRIVYVAWLNPIDTNVFKSLHLPAAQVTVRDSINGTSVVIGDGDDGSTDGKVTVQVSGRPIYVEVKE